MWEDFQAAEDIGCITMLPLRHIHIFNNNYWSRLSDNRVQQLFYHTITEFVFHNFDQLKMSNHSLTAQGSSLPFSHERGFNYHQQTIICRQLFAGEVVCSWPMKRKKKCIEW